MHAGRDLALADSYSRMIYTIEMLLGLQEGCLELLCKEAINLQGKEVKMMEKPGTVDHIHYGEWQDKVAAWLGTSRRPELCIDANLFAGLLDSVDHTASRLGVSLSTEKRVRAALMLYRDAKPQENLRIRFIPPYGGDIRQHDVEKAVMLAAG